MTKSVTINATEYLGAVTTRFVDVDITNYDDGAAGNGESFTPSDANMRRFETVICQVLHGEGGATTVQNCVAQYDESQESIRLLQQSDSGGTDADAELVEVPSNGNEGAKVRAVCMGR